jgi:hypothetical protein
MLLTAPPLVPLAVLALASSGQIAAPAGPVGVPAARAGRHAGTTAQGEPVSLQVRAGGRRAAWRIGYVARCADGSATRGRYVSGGGTPALDVRRDGTFRLTRIEPARFRPAGSGTARFTIRGRLGRDGGAGVWSVRVLTPPAGRGGRVACRTGPVRWRVARR